MTDRVVVGIDPGGKSTGIVVRRGSEYLGHAVVTNDEAAIALPPMRYLDAISAALVELGRPVPPDAWLMEAVTPPRGFKNGRRDAIQPGSLIGVAAVAGYILALLPVHLIPPAGNGSRPLRLYPPQLVGPREKTGGGILRHARSAWDVAGHTRTLTTKESTRGTH